MMKKLVAAAVALGLMIGSAIAVFEHQPPTSAWEAQIGASMAAIVAAH